MSRHERILYRNFAQVVLSYNVRINFLIFFIKSISKITDVLKSIRVLWIVQNIVRDEALDLPVIRYFRIRNLIIILLKLISPLSKVIHKRLSGIGLVVEFVLSELIIIDDPLKVTFLKVEF